MKTFLGLISTLAFCATTTQAFAAPDPDDKGIIAATPDGTLPAPRSDNDPAPPVSTPVVPEGGYVEQAGKGGTTAYGRSGVIELGGSASLAAATDYFRFQIAPSVGWFVMDNIELSALVGLSYVSVTSDGETAEQTIFSFLFEPSVHIPFTQTLFGFVGLGMGVSYADGSGAGFALQPRLGLNVMVGRSGILSPALYVQYSTHSAVTTSEGTLLAVSVGYGLNLGYTVMW